MSHMDGYRVNGAKLRALREQHGVHRAELHRDANVSLAYLKEIEGPQQRQPSVVIVNRICRALGVDKSEFCDPAEDDESADVA